MVDAVVDLVERALQDRHIGEVRAVKTLVSVLRDLVPVLHHLDSPRKLDKGLLYGLSGASLLLEDPGECLLQLEPCGQIELHSVNVEDILDDGPVDRKDRDLLPRATVDLLALEAVVEPGLGHEVHRLSNVDACREPRMVGAWEGEDVLSRHLEGLVHFHLLLLEVAWVDHGVYVQKDVGILFEKEEVLLLRCFLELFSLVLRDTVPELGLPPMVVVDGVEHQIFIVPAEGGVFHADVEPGDVDPRDVLYSGELKQRLGLAADVAQVPRVCDVGLRPVVRQGLARDAEA
jgi:hypothetical protein